MESFVKRGGATGTCRQKRFPEVSRAVLNTALQIGATCQLYLNLILEHQTYVHGVHTGSSDGLHAQVSVFIGSTF